MTPTQPTAKDVASKILEQLKGASRVEFQWHHLDHSVSVKWVNTDLIETVCQRLLELEQTHAEMVCTAMDERGLNIELKSELKAAKERGGRLEKLIQKWKTHLGTISADQVHNIIPGDNGLGAITNYVDNIIIPDLNKALRESDKRGEGEVTGE